MRGVVDEPARWSGRLKALVAVLPLTFVAAPIPPAPTASSLLVAPASAPAPVTVAVPEVPRSATRSVTATRVVRASAAVGVRAARTSPTYGVPRPALSAYQFAAQVMSATDGACRLPWELLAAIGHVESQHGSVGGSTFDREGRSQPAVIGTRLDGRRGTTAIRDTDGGRLDGDRRWDRAVGPMQFIPTTWAAAGVDADGDGERNPQDIDDAALAAAVHLCSGDEDLSTVAGARAAILRYNHSRAYVRLVLLLAEAYAEQRAIAVTAVQLPAPRPEGWSATTAELDAAGVDRQDDVRTRTRTRDTAASNAPEPADEQAAPAPSEQEEPAAGSEPGPVAGEPAGAAPEPGNVEPAPEGLPDDTPATDGPPATDEPPAEEPPAEEPAACTPEPAEPTSPTDPPADDDTAPTADETLSAEDATAGTPTELANGAAAEDGTEPEDPQVAPGCDGQVTPGSDDTDDPAEQDATSGEAARPADETS